MIRRGKPGSDPDEKHIPSVLADVSKLPTGVPFKTIAQNAKNVNETIACKECEKPRLLYSQKKVRDKDLNSTDVRSSTLSTFVVADYKMSTKTLRFMLVKI